MWWAWSFITPSTEFESKMDKIFWKKSNSYWRGNLWTSWSMRTYLYMADTIYSQIFFIQYTCSQSCELSCDVCDRCHFPFRNLNALVTWWYQNHMTWVTIKKLWAEYSKIQVGQTCLVSKWLNQTVYLCSLIRLLAVSLISLTGQQGLCVHWVQTDLCLRFSFVA